MVESDFIIESLHFLCIRNFLQVAFRFENLVHALYGSHALRDVVTCFREILQRVDDAVENHHVENEGRSVEPRLFTQDDDAAESQYNRDQHGAQEFTHRMGQCLPGGDSSGLLLHRLGHMVETRLHLVLGHESLDDAQAAERLLQLRHRVAPQCLRLQ